MSQYDEYGPMSSYGRLSEAEKLTENYTVIDEQFLALLGLERDEEGRPVRQTLTIGDKTYQAEPVISYEGAIRLLNWSKGYLANLGAYSNLEASEVAKTTIAFSKALVEWLYDHRDQYEISTKDITMIWTNIAHLVNLQLKRSQGGYLTEYTFGSMQRTYVEQNTNQPTVAQAYPQQRKNFFSRFIPGGSS